MIIAGDKVAVICMDAQGSRLAGPIEVAAVLSDQAQGPPGERYLLKGTYLYFPAERLLKLQPGYALHQEWPLPRPSEA